MGKAESSGVNALAHEGDLRYLRSRHQHTDKPTLRLGVSPQPKTNRFAPKRKFEINSVSIGHRFSDFAGGNACAEENMERTSRDVFRFSIMKMLLIA